MKKKSLFLTIIIILISIIIIIGCILYFHLLHRYKGYDLNNPWYEDDVFDIENIATIQKDPNKEFVILNLADIQICDLENLQSHQIIHDEITYLVNEIKPDLITLTGDQTWSNENLISLKTIVKWLDSYKIPYAPVFGNHDFGNSYDSAVAGVKKCCEIYEKGKYSLFKRGPNNLGSLGNYIINITENGHIYKTLYMLDLGYNNEFTNQQLAWIKWNAEGIKTINNNEYSEAIAFFHKPIPEYYEAYIGYKKGIYEALSDVTVSFSLYGSNQVGFFDLAKSIGIKDIICGHQHGNCFTINYEDVRLTFAVKTGEMCSYYNDGITNLNGATYITLNNNETNIYHYYLSKGLFHISDDNNVYRKED